MDDAGRERGQVVPLVAALLVVAGVIALGLVRVARVAGDVAAAQTAADAAALAGVTGGEAAARAVATANGGVLVEYAEHGDVVTVAVRRGCCTAEASAAWTPDADLPKAGALDPSLTLPGCPATPPAMPAPTSCLRAPRRRRPRACVRGVRSDRLARPGARSTRGRVRAVPSG